MRVAFHTLGCKVNHYETEAMREAFVSRGAESVGEDDAADVYIINTCTVTNIADRKSRQFIRRAKRLNPDAMIVVTGCYAQVEPDEVASLDEVDMVVGNGQKAKICDMVYERIGRRPVSCEGREANSATNNGDTNADREKDITVLKRNELTEYEDMGLVSSSEPGMTRAYIKIQEGCDRFCAYCLIPYARGPVRSRPPEDIVREAAMLLDSGVRELVLTGINTALYGTEQGFGYALTDGSGRVFPGLERIAAMTEEERRQISPLEIILARLDALDGYDFRIRLSSLEPTVVDRDDVEKIIRYRKLCHHLHLSVQNGSNNVLRAMNRHYTREDYLEIVRAVREYDPHYGITTDIIVGFPGETEEDFADTLDIVKEAEFGKVHVFRYSPRKGTRGASLPDAVDGNTKNERAAMLEAESVRIAEGFMRSNFGRRHKVLAEEFRDGFMTGYTDNYIRTYIRDPGRTLEEGQFYEVKLQEIYEDGCIGIRLTEDLT